MIESKVTPLTQYRNKREIEQPETAINSLESVVINEPEPETDLDWDELEVYEPKRDSIGVSQNAQ